MFKSIVVGLAIQSIIWICIVYLVYTNNTKLLFSDIIIIIVLAISLFVYFNELLLNSRMFYLLSKSIKVVKSKEDMFKFITSCKTYLEINTKYYHYDTSTKLNDNKIITYDKTNIIDFKNISDLSSTLNNNFMIKKYKTNKKIIIVNLKLFLKYKDSKCYEEINKIINNIESKASMKDEYYENNTKYVFKNLDNNDNIFVVDESSFNNNKINLTSSILLSKIWMIIFYCMLIGELYKLFFNCAIYETEIELIKQVNTDAFNNKLGNLLSYNDYVNLEDNNINVNSNLIIEFKHNNSNTNKSSFKENKVILINEMSYCNGNNNRKISNGSVKNYVKDFSCEEVMTPLIDNYDPLFDENKIIEVNDDNNKNNNKKSNKLNSSPFNNIIPSNTKETNAFITPIRSPTESDKENKDEKELNYNKNKTISFDVLKVKDKKNTNKENVSSTKNLNKTKSFDPKLIFNSPIPTTTNNSSSKLNKIKNNYSNNKDSNASYISKGINMENNNQTSIKDLIEYSNSKKNLDISKSSTLSKFESINEDIGNNNNNNYTSNNLLDKNLSLKSSSKLLKTIAGISPNINRESAPNSSFINKNLFMNNENNISEDNFSFKRNNNQDKYKVLNNTNNNSNNITKELSVGNINPNDLSMTNLNNINSPDIKQKRISEYSMSNITANNKSNELPSDGIEEDDDQDYSGEIRDDIFGMFDNQNTNNKFKGKPKKILKLKKLKNSNDSKNKDN